MILKTIAAAASIFLAMASGATAATLTIDSGQLTGATDVDVDGNLYDVSFLDGTCAALFDACDSFEDFTFTTQVSAEAASRALFDQVFIDSGELLFDSMPSLTSGCFSTSYCHFLTPFALRTSGEAYVSIITNWRGSRESRDVLQGDIAVRIDGQLPPYHIYAVWTEASLAPVPLPAGGLLLLGSLGGFATLKRRKKRAA